MAGYYDFRWGKARKSANKEKQFYSSFFMNEEEYSVNDNVIVYDDEEPDGHVAKIMKLWEENSTGNRMALLRWYLRPVELPFHLQEEQYDPKELFLAFGQGKGVLNENSVDCIERKCKVLCTSKDIRNKQPSEADIQDADYIYLRMYNVDKKKLSNLQAVVKKLGEDVLFNKEEWISNGSKENVKQCSGVIPIGLHDKDEKDGQQKVDESEVIMLEVEEYPASPTRRSISAVEEDIDTENNMLPEVPDHVLEESMNQGKVLLLQNIDPSFTSADIYDLIIAAFKGCSGGKILSRGFSSSTISGEALLVFDSEELADMALRDLEDSCLVLSDSKRPLIARKVKSAQPQLVARFPGHFPLDSFMLRKPEEEATSNTSNYFQLCAIEHEIAMEWKKLKDKDYWLWDQLFKIQREDVSDLLPKCGKPKLVIP